jgi:hypothetical protein
MLMVMVSLMRRYGNADDCSKALEWFKSHEVDFESIYGAFVMRVEEALNEAGMLNGSTVPGSAIGVANMAGEQTAPPAEAIPVHLSILAITNAEPHEIEAEIR